MKAIVLALRPKTLPAGIVPVWIGCAVSWKMTGNFSLLYALLILASTLFLQIATNFWNDGIDALKGSDTSMRLGPRRMGANGELSPRQLHYLALISLVLAVFCSMPLIYLRGWVIAAIGIPSLYFTYGYTGGFFPLAYRGMGELFVFLFFGIIAVSGTVFVQSGQWLVEGFLMGSAVGGLSTVLIGINNLRDREEDALTGKKTLAVLWGRGALVLLLILCHGFAYLCLWFCIPSQGVFLLGVPIVLGGWLCFCLISTPPSERYNRYLALAGIQLLLVGVAYQLALFS